MSPFVFFGTDEFAVKVLTTWTELNLKPALIITTPDRPAGRGLRLTPPPVKLWAEQDSIEVRQLHNLRSDLGTSLRSDLGNYPVFIVASYGKLIPAEVLALPQYGTLNIHPSLLPQYRGPSPIQTAILNGDTETGVSILLLDEQMDHGPIVQAKNYQLKAKSFREARDDLAELGAKLIAEILPDYLAGKIQPTDQNQALASFTKKIKKEDGEIKLTDPADLNYRKFLAYQPWPGTYFFNPILRSDFKRVSRSDLGTRIKITEATLENGQFVIKKIIPEGGKETDYKNQ